MQYWDCKGDYRNLFKPKFIGLGKEYCNQCGKLIPNNTEDQGGLVMYAIVKENHNKHEFTMLHVTLKDAKAEAERLCRKERACFLVFKLECRCYLEETPVTWK